MSTRRPAEEASRWWGCGGREGFTGKQYPPDELPVVQLTLAAAQPIQSQGGEHSFGQQNHVNEKPRLRWSKQLHDKFVSAVNELGGANKATPKSIWNIMQVEGVTLFHVKSHLQKYRHGKIAGRLMKRDVVQSHGRRNVEDDRPENEQTNMKDNQGSSYTSDAFDMNGNETLETKEYSNLNHLAQTIVKTENPPPISSSSNHGDLGDFPEWSGLLSGDDVKPIVSQLNSLGYLSEPDFNRICHLSRSNMMFGSFFDEVERFPKIEDDHMMYDIFYPNRGI